MSNITGDEGSFSSGNTGGEEVQQLQDQKQLQKQTNSNGSSSQQPVKKKRNLPGTPGKFSLLYLNLYRSNSSYLQSSLR